MGQPLQQVHLDPGSPKHPRRQFREPFTSKAMIMTNDSSHLCDFLSLNFQSILRQPLRRLDDGERVHVGISSLHTGSKACSPEGDTGGETIVELWVGLRGEETVNLGKRLGILCCCFDVN